MEKNKSSSKFETLKIKSPRSSEGTLRTILAWRPLEAVVTARALGISTNPGAVFLLPQPVVALTTGLGSLMAFHQIAFP